LLAAFEDRLVRERLAVELCGLRFNMEQSRDERPEVLGDQDQRVAEFQFGYAFSLAGAKLFQLRGERRVLLFKFFNEEGVDRHQFADAVEIGEAESGNPKSEIPVGAFFSNADRQMQVIHAVILPCQLAADKRWF
jgi:hypothetical protein